MMNDGRFGEDFTKEMIRRREATEGDPLRRREAVRVGAMLRVYLQDSGLMPGWNSNRVYMAWDKVSGVASLTLNRNFVKGVLYCGMSSSMVRNHLYFQKDVLLEAMNRELRADTMFFGMPADGSDPVKVLVLKFENYRNLDDAIITPCDGVNVIYGDNAQGKTNLLEAFWMFCGGRDRF